ncbi:hypothetical protein [Blastococcus sp. TF02A-30]|uniref:hypothetical protein n=1 Tax=Blastococcus sp. TF02A-30 TaxID=2250580 RepID=UPI001F173F5A|nr:hypothetical protein [Blastococcus sp. TF02A-30]
MVNTDERAGTQQGTEGYRPLLADDEGSPFSDDETPRDNRRRLRRVLAGLGVLTLVLALAVGGGLWYLTERYVGNVDRVADVFDGLDEDVRPVPTTPAQAAATTR